MKVILLILIVSAIVSVCILYIWHQRKTYVERKKYLKPGKFVEVFGRKMHMYIRGNGNPTYVLLSGFATSCPSIDFNPLIIGLEKLGKVVVIEGFGYGWSEYTDRERTNDNIVDEIHQALQKSKLKPPYILVVHSLSGIYSLAYCQKYKEDIIGVVALDTTIPIQFQYMHEKLSVHSFYYWLTRLGFVRFVLQFFPQIILPPDEGIYSQHEREIIRSKYSIRAYNPNLIDEFQHILINAKEMERIQYPTSIPVLCFLSSETNNKSKEWDRSWYMLHEDLLQSSLRKKVVQLDGKHYLHWTKSKEIIEEMKSFFN